MQSLNVRASSIVMRSTLVATVVEDGAVLLDLESKYFYALNESAWAIAQLFENESVSVEAILDCCRRWGAQAPDEIAVREFLNQMSACGLLEECAPAPRVPFIEFKGEWRVPVITRQREPLQTIVTSAFDPSVPLAE